MNEIEIVDPPTYFRLSIQEGDRALHDISCLTLHFQMCRPTKEELGEPGDPGELGSKVVYKIVTQFLEPGEIYAFLGSDLSACGPCNLVLHFSRGEDESEIQVDGARIQTFSIGSTLHLVWIATSTVS